MWRDMGCEADDGVRPRRRPRPRRRCISRARPMERVHEVVLTIEWDHLSDRVGQPWARLGEGRWWQRHPHLLNVGAEWAAVPL